MSSVGFYFPPSRVQFRRQIEAAIQRATIVAIEGGAGIGKTTILEEVLTESTPNANKCYVTLGANFSDVQIRSRIIEQLFGNVLFDPEKPLLSSFIEFNRERELFIAIDNGHFMSGVLVGELLQLFSQLRQHGIQIYILIAFGDGSHVAIEHIFCTNLLTYGNSRALIN